MIPEWLLFSGASGNAIKLFAVLHRHEGPGGIFPSRERLARLMECSLDTVDRLTRQLIAAGAVAVEARHAEGRQTSNAYRLFFTEGAAILRLPRAAILRP